jgi:hypothetical protein
MKVDLAYWECAQLFTVLSNTYGPAGYVRQVGKILDAITPPPDRYAEIGWNPVTIDGMVRGFAGMIQGNISIDIELPPDHIRLIQSAMNAEDLNLPASPAINALLDKIDDWVSSLSEPD